VNESWYAMSHPWPQKDRGPQRLAALSARLWDEPLIRDDETFDLGGPITGEDIREITEQAARAKQQRFETNR
jgi:hypothetical protein